VAWLSVAVRLLRSGNPFRDRRQFLLWVLYGGFGLQLALGALLAYSGGISGNLQVRLFPAFMLLAFPLLTSGIAPPFRAPRVPPRSRRWVVILLLVTLWASVASLLKATNEASLANYWNFWTPAEERAVHWVESALNYRSVWLGYGNIRASARATGESFGRTSDNTTDSFSVDTETRDLILSSAEAQLSLRRGAPLPDVRAENRVYDNGWAQMYHKRPRTPYQR
jgi:hypothetical protein